MNYMKYILFILIRNLENNSQRCNDKYSYSFILIAPNLKYKTMLIRGFITNKWSCSTLKNVNTDHCSLKQLDLTTYTKFDNPKDTVKGGRYVP